MGREVWWVKDRVEDKHHGKHDGVEEISGNENTKKAYEILQYAHLDLADKVIFSGQILLQQPKGLEFLQMVRCHTGAA